MAVVGKIIKAALNLRQLVEGEYDPAALQQRQLKMLLTKARHTAFGKYYNYEGMLKASNLFEVYRDVVPIHQYEDIHRRWWKQQQVYPDITWPGQPDYFARTSGTTGDDSKRIPVTEDFIKSMRSVGMSQLTAISQIGLPDEVFESEALIISSSPRLDSHSAFDEGEISGINVSNFPDWYELFYRPGKEIAGISDWDKRTEAIASEAHKWNIGAIAGIPSWVQKCLHKVLSANDVEYVDDLWPNARLFISGGVAFKTYAQSFRSLFRQPIVVLDTYLASEGFFAFGDSANTLDMQLALNHGYYYEFIPFDGDHFDASGELKPDAKSVSIDGVVSGQDYALVISTCAGAWRYMIGDIIQFADTEAMKIRITGRTKFFMNVVGSQLSEEKLDEAIKACASSMGISVNEYSLACMEHDGEYLHQWVLISDDTPDASKTAECLDKTLKEKNRNYSVARQKTLDHVRVKFVSTSLYDEWLREKNQMGGQTKIQKVMEEADMNVLLAWVKDKS